MRRGALVAVAAVVSLGLVSLPAAGAAGDPVKARKEAQERANKAAARLARAESELSRVEDELGDLEARADGARSSIRGLEAQVREVAINSYVHGSSGPAAVFDNDLSRTARGQAFIRYVTLGDTDAIDGYRAAREDLEEGASQLARRVNERKRAASALDKERRTAFAELERLAKLEKEFLVRQAAERAAAEKRAAQARAAGRRAAQPTARVAPAVGRAAGVIAGGDWVCPVQGPRAFSNDWGQPRSGGRRHQGNDILSPRGTPVVANVAGSVRHHNSSLGGLSYYLRGNDGNTYFGTHLSAFGAGGNVAAGTVIGYVGDSGNARGTNHLHFEIHPGGGGPVNPYPTLSRYC